MIVKYSYRVAKLILESEAEEKMIKYWRTLKVEPDIIFDSTNIVTIDFIPEPKDDPNL